MPEVQPFRGVSFDPDKVGDLSSVITQPYDKIDEARQVAYLDRSEWNAVRLILDPHQDADTKENNGLPGLCTIIYGIG